MNRNSKVRLLEKAKKEFSGLSTKSIRKARIFKFFDLFFKSIISILGALIAFFAGQSDKIPSIYLRVFGIFISALPAISSILLFEKRAHSHLQIHSKCELVLPEIEEKLEIVNDPINEDSISFDQIHEYLKQIFKELADLSLASFTDSAFGKISS